MTKKREKRTEHNLQISLLQKVLLLFLILTSFLQTLWMQIMCSAEIIILQLSVPFPGLTGF